jgi:hypothetical protein
MRVYELTLKKSILVDGKETTKTEVVLMNFPDSAEEITMKQWTAFQIRKSECPDFIRALDRLEPAERQAAMEAWEEENWIQFFSCAAEMMSCVVDVKYSDLLKSMPPIADGQTSLLALYVQLAKSIDGYQPKEPNEFTWKGHKYIWPKSVVEKFGQKWYGNQLTTAEAIEALQTEHVYNAKDENGEFVLKDRKYHVDITLVALLSRRVKPNGEIEEIPLEFNSRRAFVDRRVEEFEDLPMSVALDMAFFLTTSKVASALTLISRMPSTSTPTISLRPRP